MINKRGFMLGEYTLKVVIAVLCLLLLFYLLFSLYSNSVDERNLQLAGASLNELVEKMGEAKSKGQEQTVTLLTPSDWYIYTFKQNFKNKPIACEDNCICICDSYANWVGGNAEDCDEKGVCKNVDEEIDFYRPEENFMKVFGDFNIRYNNNKFTITKK